MPVPLRSLRRLRAALPYVSRCGVTIDPKGMWVRLGACGGTRPFVFRLGGAALGQSSAVAVPASAAALQTTQTTRPAAPVSPVAATSVSQPAAQPQDACSPEPTGYPLVYTLPTANPTGKPPFLMMAVGDSIMWGTGMCREHKYKYLVAQALAQKLGRDVARTFTTGTTTDPAV